MTNDQYFPHDASAGNNSRLTLLVDEQGMKGYGIYWALLEYLRQQEGYRCDLRLIKSLSYKFQCCEEDVKDVIHLYDLFIIDGDFFYSPGLQIRMAVLDDRRKKLSNAGVKGNEVKDLKKKKIEVDGKTSRKASRMACPKACKDVDAVKESRVSKVSKESKEEKASSSATDDDATREEIFAAVAVADDGVLKGKKTENGIATVGKPLQPYLGWDRCIDLLAGETVWMEVTAQHSTLGIRFIEDFPHIATIFKDHLRCLGKESSIMSLDDAKNYMYHFVTNASTRKKLILALEKSNQSAPAHSPYEQRDKDGNRSYNGLPIPAHAPLRPNDRCLWNEDTGDWG
ncbi:Lin1244/Lin1753 domain-containing protein [Phocaeicola sp.]